MSIVLRFCFCLRVTKNGLNNKRNKKSKKNSKAAASNPQPWITKTQTR